MRRLTVSAAVAATMCTALAPAHAAPPDADDIAREQADTSFKTGLRFFKQADYLRAWLEFSKANAIYPRGTLFRNLGLCELKLNKPLDALKHFRAAVTASDTKPDQRVLAQEDVGVAYGLTGHIAVHGNDGATISVDGQDLAPIAKEPVDVLPGHHVIEAHLGGRTAKAEVDATAGVVVDANVHVEPPVPPVATVAPTAPSTPPTRVDLPPPPPTPPPTSSSWDGRTIAGVVTAGAGVASLATAVILGLVGNSKGSDADSYRAQHPGACSNLNGASCTSYQSLLNDEQNAATWSRVFYVATGVLAVGSVVLLWPHGSADSRRAWIAPAITPNTAGVRLGGSF